MLKEAVGISVLLVAYNHEKHIRQALNSLFGQVFDGPIELVVADDKSSDSTLSIIQEYEGADPRFTFKYLDYSENLGITKNYKRGFEACTSEFVAVLEGDDYWISPCKLQRQVDFLTAHWESDVCSVNYYVYEEDRAHLSPRVPASAGHRFISARELIADNVVGNFSTCMYRRSALSRLPEGLFDIKSYDWITNIVLAKTSLIGFLEEPMSVYRLHGGGVWTQTPHIDKLKAQLAILPAYDALTDNVFHEDFERLSSHLRHLITVSQLGHVAESVGKPVFRVIPTLVSLMPPVFIMVIKLLVPVAVMNLLARVVKRSRSV
ncbi:glycosyltransferase [Pseudomonas sp. DP16D-R1]|uniref:glycosyltransferase family 2 protein n=1 Tax=Pseudomonas sp. DP16D-R1 TaxID=2075551 RepID=UPI000CD0A855|nr:glycosyltransferase [Pseudomonas sp. DP16D-R1]POA76363.1 glycosyl transferase [Pseudomonas sp. DP16D-R1]